MSACPAEESRHAQHAAQHATQHAQHAPSFRPACQPGGPRGLPLHGRLEMLACPSGHAEHVHDCGHASIPGMPNPACRCVFRGRCTWCAGWIGRDPATMGIGSGEGRCIGAGQGLEAWRSGGQGSLLANQIHVVTLRPHVGIGPPADVCWAVSFKKEGEGWRGGGEEVGVGSCGEGVRDPGAAGCGRGAAGRARE